MRLDKYLKVSRVIKRRSVAKEIADKGRISINGKIVKSYEMTVAEQLVSRRFKEGTEPRKIARFLQYRGFSPSVIREILSGFGW